MNMQSANLVEISDQIKRQIEDEDYTPITLLGKSGIGKTEMVRTLARKMGVGYVELRLSHYQESDLIGLPYLDESGMTAHAPSRILPPTADEGQGILLLDEVTSAPKSMRSAVYQLLDDSRRLGEYLLPKRWLVIAAGNGPDDGGDFRGIEPAFLSRGFCWRIREDITVWKNWAEKQGVHPMVISYLTFKPEMLHVMDTEQPYDMIACPRNWVKLAGQLEHLEKRSPDRTIQSRRLLEFSAAGCIGASHAPDFCTFYLHKDEVLDPAEIIEGRIPPEDMGKLSEEGLYITAQSFVRYLAAESGLFHNRAEQDIEAVARAVSWIVRVGTGVRLDCAVSMMRELNAAVEGRLAGILLTEEFERACPEFGDFAEETFRG